MRFSAFNVVLAEDAFTRKEMFVLTFINLIPHSSTRFQVLLLRYDR